MPSDAPLTIRIAQTIGLTSSAWLAGQIASFSLFTVPRLLESPTPLMLRQWSAMFWAGKSVGMPGGIVTALTYFYLAYATHTSSASSFLSDTTSIRYAVAGILSVGIVPFTLVFLNSTNVAIFKREEEVSKAEREGKSVQARAGEESAQDLLRRWGTLNLGRAVVMLGSAVLGAWTTINA